MEVPQRVGQTLAALAEGGMGIANLGDSVDLRGFSLPTRPLRDGGGKALDFDLHLAWLAEKRLTPWCKRFVEHLAA